MQASPGHADLLWRDGECLDAHTHRIIDSIGNGRRDGTHGGLGHALSAQGAGAIVILHHDGGEARRQVMEQGQAVLEAVAIQELTVAVDHLLVHRIAQAHDATPVELALAGHRVDGSAYISGNGVLQQGHFAGLRVDLHLGRAHTQLPVGDDALPDVIGARCTVVAFASDHQAVGQRADDLRRSDRLAQRARADQRRIPTPSAARPWP